VATHVSAPPSTEPGAGPVTRLTWAHAASASWPSFAEVPSSGQAHEPWIPAPVLPRVITVLRAAGLAAVVGLVGGVTTSYVESLVGSPLWSHSFAPWAAITTGVGFALRGRWQVAAMAGLVTQLGLLLGFCLSQPAFSGSAPATETVATYVVLVLVAGPFCGVAPGFLRDECVATRTLALGIVSAPWVADGVRMMVSALGHEPRVAARLVVGAALMAVGVALPLAINGSSRDSLRNLGVLTGLGVLMAVSVMLFPKAGGPDAPPADLSPPRIGLPADPG
jgi:hypothetical protein